MGAWHCVLASQTQESGRHLLSCPGNPSQKGRSIEASKRREVATRPKLVSRTSGFVDGF